MKLLLFISLAGLGVGILYGLIRVKSPAPPLWHYWAYSGWYWVSSSDMGSLQGR